MGRGAPQDLIPQSFPLLFINSPINFVLSVWKSYQIAIFFQVPLQLLKFSMCPHFTSNIYIASINVSNGIMIKFKSCFSIFMVYDHFAAFHTANHYLLETGPLVSITVNSPSSVSWTTLSQLFFTECLSSLLLVLFTRHYYSLSQNCLCILFLYHLYVRNEI